MDAGKSSLAVLFFVIVLVGAAYAQAPDTLWTRTYEIRADEGFFGLQHFSVWQTIDGGFAVAACSVSTSSLSTFDFFLMKVDSMGEYLWGHHYPQGTGQPEVFHVPQFVQQTTDGGFILIGWKSVNISPYETLFYSYLVKTDSSGESVWQRTSGSGQLTYSGQQTSDGGYICAGYADPPYSDFLLSKRNSQGYSQWNRTYDGSVAFSVQETYDGGYILAGRTASHGAGGYDCYLVKTDIAGDTLWTKTYGGTGRDIARCVRQIYDGCYVICGETGTIMTYHFYLIKTNSIGDTLWTRTYSFGSGDVALSVQPTDDGGYILVGYSGAAGTSTYYRIMKTDSVGTMEWTEEYGYGKATSVERTRDGGYIIAGVTGADDLYLIRLASEGSSVTHGINNIRSPESYSLCTPYPNPFNSIVTIPYDVGGNGKVNVSVYNVLGEHVGTVAEHYASPGSYSVRWDAGELPSGIYFVRMEAGNYRQVRKVVLLK